MSQRSLRLVAAGNASREPAGLSNNRGARNDNESYGPGALAGRCLLAEVAAPLRPRSGERGDVRVREPVVVDVEVEPALAVRYLVEALQQHGKRRVLVAVAPDH